MDQETLIESEVSEVFEIPGQGKGEVVDVNPIPALTADEDNFALAVIEYGGNLRYAYCEVFGAAVKNPVAKARMLLNRPHIALRIKQITEAVHENAFISLGSHLVELADIRDMAKDRNELKTALAAEEARGKVAGFYVGKEVSRKPGDMSNPMVVIQISTPHDASI
jgi:hypothetical protein